MATDFDKAKGADQHTKDVVNGFIRQSQSLLPDDHYHCIPELVILFCILYYYDEITFHPFDASSCGPNVVISGDKNEIMTHDKWTVETAYTSKWIPSIERKIVKFALYITKCVHTGLFIGISSDRTLHTQSYVGGHKGSLALRSNGDIFYNRNQTENKKEYRYNTGDVLIVIIDFLERKLFVKINDKQPLLIGLINTGKDIQYKLCVSSWSPQEVVEILQGSDQRVRSSLTV